jgi:hypothetical protein
MTILYSFRKIHISDEQNFYKHVKKYGTFLNNSRNYHCFFFHVIRSNKVHPSGHAV